MKNYWTDRKILYWGVRIFDDDGKEVTTDAEPVVKIDLPLRYHLMPVIANVGNYFPKSMEKIKCGKMILYACRGPDESDVYPLVGQWTFEQCLFFLHTPVDFQQYAYAEVDYYGGISYPLTNEFTLPSKLGLDLSHSHIGIGLPLP